MIRPLRMAFSLGGERMWWPKTSSTLNGNAKCEVLGKCQKVLGKVVHDNNLH